MPAASGHQCREPGHAADRQPLGERGNRSSLKRIITGTAHIPTLDDERGRKSKPVFDMTTDKKPRSKADFKQEGFDNEVLLYHPDSTIVLYLNETASIIWRLCDGNRTTTEIVALLTDAFPEEAETIEQEVEVTMRSFLEHEAIEFV